MPSCSHIRVNSKRPPMPLAATWRGSVSVFIKRIDQHHMIGKLGARPNQRRESAGSDEIIGASR